MGRPTKLTPAITEAICALLLEGVPQEAAALANSERPIGTSTYFRWMNRGDLNRDGYDPKKDAPYREFREAVESARAKAESSFSLLVRKAAVGGDVKAAMWWLDRAHPERWAQRKDIQVSGPDEGPIKVIWPEGA